MHPCRMAIRALGCVAMGHMLRIYAVTSMSSSTYFLHRLSLKVPLQIEMLQRGQPPHLDHE